MVTGPPLDGLPSHAQCELGLAQPVSYPAFEGLRVVHAAGAVVIGWHGPEMDELLSASYRTKNRWRQLLDI